jgi:hypothetical protein
MIFGKDLLPVEAIYERDIDMLLLEELNVNAGFVDWLVSQLQLPLCTAEAKAFKSISDSTLSECGAGETDLLLSYTAGKEQVLVLIENKVDAVFMPNQHKRYEQRAAARVAAGQCTKAYSVLIAPEAYVQQQFHFKLSVSYEQLKNYFLKQNTRGEFKAKLLEIAIDKLRRSSTYSPVNNELVLDFFLKYRHFKQTKFPALELDIKPAQAKGSRASWVRLHDKRLKGIQFIHKLSDGIIDITFGKQPSEGLHRKLKQDCPLNTSLISHKKSSSFRVTTSKIAHNGAFAPQEKQVKEALQKLEILHRWMLDNYHLRTDV